MLFESVYLHYSLPAWSNNLSSKTTRKPKVHFTDSGLASVLCGVDPQRLRQPDATMTGALLETFVAGEICRQLTWSDVDATAFHWRDRDGAEVDIVLERPSGEVVGIEVKSALDVDPSDFKGLRLLRDRLGSRFIAGVVMHVGNTIQPFGDRLHSVPVSCLWSGQ
jgi:uncharacterized protein